MSANKKFLISHENCTIHLNLSRLLLLDFWTFEHAADVPCDTALVFSYLAAAPSIFLLVETFHMPYAISSLLFFACCIA